MTLWTRPPFKQLGNAIGNVRVRNERAWQKRAIAVANRSAKRVEKARAKKFVPSVAHPGKFHHPTQNKLVTEQQVRDDAQWVAEKVRTESLKSFAKDPKALDEQERKDAEIEDRKRKRAQRSSGRGLR